MDRDKLINFINKTLKVEEGKDPWLFNGLQVLGKNSVSKIALGVSANLEMFEKAGAWGADMIILHHGLLGPKGTPITKVLKDRLKALFDHDMTLLTYHLYLDKDEELGNNAQLIKLLGAKKEEKFGRGEKNYWGWKGSFNRSITIDLLVKRLEKLSGKKAKIFKYGPKSVKNIAVLTGGGAYHLKEAADQNLDVYITGEANESTQAWAKEAGIHFIYLGHYNSEKFGVLALGDLLKKKFKGLEIKFIDVPNDL